MNDLFEDVGANSEWAYVDDAGQVGFGLTSAPIITDGFYMDDDGEFTDDGHSDSKVYVWNNYMIKDLFETLMEQGSVELSEVKSDKEYAKGGEIDSFSEYQVFYNDEEMIKVIKDKSSQDAYNVSYLGLLENDELPSVIDEVLNNRRKLSKSESEDLYRKLKGKRGIEIRNVVDGKSTDKRGKKIITPSEFRKILKDLGFKVSFKRNSLGVFAIVKDSEGKELPTIFMDIH